MANGQNIKKRDRIGVWLYLTYLLLLICGVWLFIRLVCIMIDPGMHEKTIRALTPSNYLKTDEPDRGNIYDCNGKLLAISCPSYQFRMDCTVLKDSNDDEEEIEWLKKADSLSAGLAKEFPTISKTEFYNKIVDKRNNKGKYVKIGSPVDRNAYNRIIRLPLFREGRYKSGVQVEVENLRHYPYGKLARRTIGFVRDNKSNAPNTHVGLEGKFDYELHGKEGKQWMRNADYGSIANSDSAVVRVEHGKDLITTLNIDYQAIADKALRRQIDTIEALHDACLVIMDVQSGAIRAMVNLSRATTDGRFDEVSNIAIGRRGEPGSVFKTVTLMSVLNDGYISSLEETIPTNGGKVKGTTHKRDQHVLDYEREHNTKEISVLEGFKMSSNYVFATLAVENYGTKAGTEKFLQNIYSYKLGETFDFDLDGMLTPTIPSPETRYWTNTDLGSIAFGYSTEMTPLHILSFYNAIANDGRMMKPYLVERIEKDGRTVSKRGPSVLNSAICTKAVADTITRALKGVTEDGTARRLKGAKVPVAGKTGTSFGIFPNGKYEDEEGQRIYQGTFVGFFPADNPKYSVICEIFSEPTQKSFQGGGIPARAIREVVDEIYNIDPFFRETIR